MRARAWVRPTGLLVVLASLLSSCGGSGGPVRDSGPDGGDLGVSCGDGVVNGTETCDVAIVPGELGSCPAVCDDGNSCTTDTRSGVGCGVMCAFAPKACGAGDGCCPAGCTPNQDPECFATCGDDVVEGVETCDGNCPTTCVSDGDPCTTDRLTGTPSSCNVECTHLPVTQCTDNDGCCPSSGSCSTSDNDCAAVCGNGVVEAGETCDGNCPSSCPDDGNPCTTSTLTGSAGSCNVACTYPAITACANGDGCCPTGCNSTNDNSCSASCPNGVTEPPETCDGTCPTTCDDANACTTNVRTGAASSCNVQCSYPAVLVCQNGDGCCPSGCNATNDNNCTPMCGNGIVEGSEICDGNCPVPCPADGNACTTDLLTGSAGACNAQCSYPVITACGDNDGCCPSGCTYMNDNNCEGPVAFRINSMALRDPHVLVPLLCTDVTNNGIPLAGITAVNTALMNNLTSRQLNPILLFDPLDQVVGAMNPLRVVFGQCSSATSCTAGTPMIDVTSTYTNGMGGTCLAPFAGTTTASYTPAVPTVNGACFASGSLGSITVPIILSQGTLNIPLQSIQLGAVYQSMPATGLTGGLLRGFLSEDDADATDLPDGLPLIGGDPLGRLFRGGSDNGCSGDDRDLLMPGVPESSTNPRGWWFYIAFTAQRVTFN